MTTTKGDSNYDFFNKDLWLTPIDSIDDVVDTTFKIFKGFLSNIPGLDVSDLLRLIHQAGGKNYQTETDQIEGENYQTLIDKLDSDMKSGNMLFWRLIGMIKTTLQMRQIPLNSTTWKSAVDFDFQVIQLLNLYSLGGALNNFLWNVFPNLIPKLISSHKEAQTLPPVHLLRESFRQMSIDCEIMQRAMIQRRWQQNSPTQFIMSSQAYSVLITDKLAHKALAPFQHLLPSHPNISILTFFSEKTHIRQLPYTDQFILVGLSYDCTPPNLRKGVYVPKILNQGKHVPTFELMAIPHEVGHYLYHQARIYNGKSFADLGVGFKENAYAHWCEEIFADLYGCLVAGPLSALGMQALLASGNKERLWHDDEDHPTPILRPYIMSEILRVLSQSESQSLRDSEEQQLERYVFTKVADMLDANWTAFLQQCGFELTKVVNDRPKKIKLPANMEGESEAVVKVKKVMKKVQPIIESFVKELFAQAKFTAWQTNDSAKEMSAEIPWSDGNVTSLTEYDGVMANLTNMEFARKKVPGHTLFEARVNYEKTRAATPDEQLQRCEDNWGHRGPHGSGGGTYT
jgi:hypothetical protein